MSYQSLLPPFMLPVSNKIIERGTLVSSELIPVYRATKNKHSLTLVDFNCQIEENRGSANNPGHYACSVNWGQKGKNELASKLDTVRGMAENNPYVAVGKIRENSGLIEINSEDHVNWWIFDSIKKQVPKDFKHYSDVANFIEEKEENNEYR